MSNETDAGRKLAISLPEIGCVLDARRIAGVMAHFMAA
jgi:hypothetical protein